MPRWVHMWPVPAYLAGLYIYRHASRAGSTWGLILATVIFAIVAALWPLAAWWGTRD